VKWFRKAAEQGEADGQFKLGYLYHEGEAVPQDYAEAARWYREAADQGSANAQYNLGVMCGEGQGIPQDYVQAHMWFNLAGASGDLDGIKNRDGVARKMTPDEIAGARRRAQEWEPKTGR